MRIILFTLIIIFISSCSSLDTSNIAPGYKEAYKSVKAYFFESEDTITQELIENIPYASALLKIGKGPKGLLILKSVTNGKYNWVSADNIIITTNQYGKIIGTKGLSNNLSYIEFSYKGFDSIDLGYKYYSYFTFEPPKLNLLPVESLFRSKGLVLTSMLKGQVKLTRVEEDLNNSYLGWSETNLFWIDADGFIWKSKQYISPKLPPFYLQITKKPTI